ncbi:MAG: hypothetical protein H0V48_12270 [Nocardioidaceae bacterium]|nr:hypothetical protein [Nocardioidaceae bacterium]
MSNSVDNVETHLQHRLRLKISVIGSLMSTRAPGQRCEKAFRAALREAVQRRDSAQHDLDMHLSTRSPALVPVPAVY